jgi:hypothetical protein
MGVALLPLNPLKGTSYCRLKKFYYIVWHSTQNVLMFMKRKLNSIFFYNH